MGSNYHSKITKLTFQTLAPLSVRIEDLWVLCGLCREGRALPLVKKWWCDMNKLVKRDAFIDSMRTEDAELKKTNVSLRFLGFLCFTDVRKGRKLLCCKWSGSKAEMARY